MNRIITSSYEHRLQYALSRIERRGVLIDTQKLSGLRRSIAERIASVLKELSLMWGVHVYMGVNKESKKIQNSLNIGSRKQLMAFLKSLGIKIPKVPPSKDKRDKGETDWKESTNELSLRKIFSETGILGIKLLMEIYELNTILARYIDAMLVDNVFYTNYDAAGTKTGRRSSKKLIFGWGGNAQNWPKHSKIGESYRECIIARPGKIFLNVDQKSAEDWPVSALGKNISALNELRAGVNRHRKLASYIFTLPEASILKNSMEYHLGKKARHAKNYGMRAPMLSTQLAAEGYFVPIDACMEILRKIDMYDPSIEQVFHAYIHEQIELDSRKLITPFGRERIFFGFRHNSANYALWNDAYSWIPQSVVGDNTGLAIVALELGDINHMDVLGDSHDSILSEVSDSVEYIEKALTALEEAFNREIIFDNGICINIPTELEMGYDLGHMHTVNRDTIQKVLQECLEEKIKGKKETSNVSQTVRSV